MSTLKTASKNQLTSFLVSINIESSVATTIVKTFPLVVIVKLRKEQIENRLFNN